MTFPLDFFVLMGGRALHQGCHNLLCLFDRYGAVFAAMEEEQRVTDFGSMKHRRTFFVKLRSLGQQPYQGFVVVCFEFVSFLSALALFLGIL